MSTKNITASEFYKTYTPKSLGLIKGEIKAPPMPDSLKNKKYIPQKKAQSN